MSGAVSRDVSSSPVRKLLVLAGLMVLMGLCMRTMRFTQTGMNLAFECLFLLLPFFAIKPALRLPRWGKIASLALLLPLFAYSSVDLLAMAACDAPIAMSHHKLSRELSTLQQGQYSVHLAEEETAGGAVGPHGVILEQRRAILPGLYAVKALDYFEDATEGSLSAAGPNTVSLYIPIAGYNQDQRDIHRTYSLKPWLYF